LLRAIGFALLGLLVLGLIVASIYLIDYSSSRPAWERLLYWALSALLIIIAACPIFISIMYTAYIMLEEWEKWRPEF
jgi:uncharacterized protein (DUF983 family)